MKITVNRQTPVPPPVTSITCEFTVDQLRFIKYLAARDRDHRGAAESLSKKLNSLPELNIPVNWEVRF